MMSRTVQITIDAHDPRGLSVFWREALGYVHPAPPGMILAPGADAAAALVAWDDFLERANVPRSQWNSSSALEDPDGTGPRIYFQQVPEDKVAKNRWANAAHVGAKLLCVASPSEYAAMSKVKPDDMEIMSVPELILASI